MKKFLFIAFFLNLFIIIVFWWQGSASLFDGKISNIIFAFGKLCGLLAVYAILLQFVLRGRAVWIEEVFGLNNLSTVHRLNGYLVLVFLLLHFTFILTSYSIFTKTDVVSQLITFITSETDFLYAFLALILFITIVFLSVYIVRKRLKYETWYYTHLFTYLAILLAWGHQLKFGGDFVGNMLFTGYWYAIYFFVFGNFFVFRYLRQGFLFYKYRFSVAKVVQETEDTTSVYISGNNLSRFSLQPGQFFILRFLDSIRWWQAHPFSLSFVPKDNQLRVTIKNVGDFTSEIPQLKEGTPILLDGPLGTFTQKSATKDRYLFIVGGVGITPVRALIEQLTSLNKDMILLYSNKTSNFIFKKELDVLKKQYKFPLYYIVTEEASYKGEKGRIDKEKIVRLAPDFLKRDIYLCGPPPMMEALIKLLHEMGVSREAIHYERFDL